MLNYNPSAKIPIHTNHAWLTTPKSRFSDDEKRELISSVLFLGPNFNNFVNSFYKVHYANLDLFWLEDNQISDGF